MQKIPSQRRHRNSLPIIRRAAPSSSVYVNLRSRSIKRIPHNGMRDRRKMYANLMRAPGIQLHFHESRPIDFRERPPIRPRLPGIARQPAAAKRLPAGRIGT